MRILSRLERCRFAAVAAVGIVAVTTAPLAPTLAAQVPPDASVVAATKPLVDGGWPRAYTTSSGARLLIYQPQVAEWPKQERMVAFAAVSYQPTGAPKPELGTVKFETTTRVSVQERLVNFSPLRIAESNFQTLAKDATRDLLAELGQILPAEHRVIALDRVLAQVDKSALTPKNAVGIKEDPPGIYISKTPAVLVNLDGAPIWSPIADNDLRFAVNTNWDLFEHEPTSAFYLRYEGAWLQAPAVTGPWHPAGKLPASFSKLPDDDNWKEVRATLPGKPASAGLKVLVAAQPAELLLFEGEPRFEPVAGTGLLWVSNTESDVFRLGADGPFYYLVTGRWFSSSTGKGPWTFATTSLPEDFKRIPREHPRSRVLASVPGSDEAVEAVLLASIPQTARVNRNEIQAPAVTYQGEPEFQPVDGTTVARAANTDKDILKAGDLYYMCFEGVWFVGQSPNGPWEATASVPGEIYEIPASSPAYHVTYVEVEEDDDVDDEWINYACYGGYTGLMVAWGCAVWGTGWYYPPSVWWGPGHYPIYYPYARTYGYAAWYNPWTGGYGTAGRAYGPYGGAAFGARYNPATGTYARGAAAWGPHGARGAAVAHNPRTGASATTWQGASVYGSWGATSVQRGDDWAQTKRVTNRAAGTTTRVTRTDDGSMVSRRGQDGGIVAKGQDNVYAGKDGNVYRKNENGSWQQWDSGNWSSVDGPDRPKAETFEKTGDARREPARERPEPKAERPRVDSSTYQQLERDRGSRNDGAQRTRDYNNYQNRGGNSGSYRPSGGGGRSNMGGGGRGGGGRGGGRRRG